jgi:hypothetical protein
MGTVSWSSGWGDFTDQTAWNTDTIPGSGDTVQITAPGSYTVVIEGNAAIAVEGLTLAANAGLLIDGGSSLALSSSLNNSGRITLLSGAALELAGSVVNAGVIAAPANGENPAWVTFGPGTENLVLEGGGQFINLSFDGSGTLENAGNRITGAGYLGPGLTFVNDRSGVLDANALPGANGGHDVYSIATGNTVTNAGVLEATGGGALVISDTVVNVNQGGPGGEIKALSESAGFVALEGATIVGGTLITSGGGAIEVPGYDPNDDVPGDATLDGSSAAVVNYARIIVSNQADLFLKGTIDNKAAINLAASGSYSNIDIDSSTLTLEGGGHIELSTAGSSGNVLALQAGDTLINDGNHILGSGTIGDGRLVLDNLGTIDANIANAGLTMVLDAYGMATSVNDLGSTVGVIETTADTVLFVTAGPQSNPNLPDLAYFTNKGVIKAAGGGTVALGGNVLLTNLQTSALIGGSWEAVGQGSTLVLNGLPTIDQATIVLSGAGSVIESGDGATLETVLTTVGAGGVLEMLAGRNYSTPNAIELAAGGKLQLGGGTFASGGIDVATGATLAGFGAATGKLTNDGAISAAGGTLDLTGAVTGTGQASVQGAATLEFGAAVGLNEKVSFAKGGGTLMLQDARQFAGSITGFGAGGRLDIDHFGQGTTLAFQENNAGTEGKLTLTDGSSKATIQLFGQYSAANFSLSQGSQGDSLVTFAPNPSATAVQFASGHG